MKYIPPDDMPRFEVIFVDLKLPHPFNQVVIGRSPTKEKGWLALIRPMVNESFDKGGFKVTEINGFNS